MGVVTGRIEPMVFGPGEAAAAVAAVSRTEIEDMANAAQGLWDLLRTIDLRRIDKLEETDPELAQRLMAVRAAMR